jgi:hypothetical protein
MACCRQSKRRELEELVSVWSTAAWKRIRASSISSWKGCQFKPLHCLARGCRMIEIADISPDIAVPPAEYHRLLGYPRGHALQERARELAGWARAWYAAHGRPWVYARYRPRSSASGADIVLLEGTPISRRTFAENAASFRRPWRDCRGDERGSGALEERATGTVAGRKARRILSSWKCSDPRWWNASHHDDRRAALRLGRRRAAWRCCRTTVRDTSDWDIREQMRLLNLLRRGGQQPLPGELETLESGALRPKKSQLAVFALTRHTERVRRLTTLSPCENCSYTPCQFRRAAYVRGTGAAPIETVRFVALGGAPVRPTNYSINRKALRRWAAERLTITHRDDGNSDARFRYQGTTCTNMGRPLEFDYQVSLGRREEGYPILEARCAPAPGDTGHTFMCQYDADGKLLAAVDAEKPLLGRPLHEVLAWRRPLNAAGCYCEPESRQHKWGLVLETIHYALLGPETPAGET